MTSEEILEELSAQTEDIKEFFGLTFEVLEDYWAIADTRLTAFANEKMWVVAIEVVGFDRACEHTLRVYLLGNCIKEREEYYAANFERILFTVPNHWNKEIEKDQLWGIDRDGFAIRWKGIRFDLTATLEELEEASIELSKREIATGELTPQQMLRYLCEKWEHPFFMSEDGLRDLLAKSAIDFEWKYIPDEKRSWYENHLGEFEERPILSTDLELILQTRDWIHPKVGDGISTESGWEISPREAFETLSQFLATRDLTVWEQQDKSKFNSHWRNWALIDANIERSQIEAIKTGKQNFRAFIEGLPLEAQEKQLLAIRENIENSPSGFLDFGNHYLRYEGQEITLFRELKEEIDALLSELKNR